MLYRPLSCYYSRRKFTEHEKSVRVARGAKESSSSFSSALVIKWCLRKREAIFTKRKWNEMKLKWNDQKQFPKKKRNDPWRIQGCKLKLHLLFHGLTGNTNGFFTPVVVLKNYRRRSKVTRTLVTFGISILWARFPLHGVVTFEGSLLSGSKKSVIQSW